MKRKKFYTLIERDGVTGAIKKSGFKAKENGTEIYIYQGRNGMVHAIDPDTGLAVYQEYFERKIDELDPTEIEHFIGLSTGWAEQARMKECYPKRCKIFKLHKRAARAEAEYKKWSEEDM